MEFEKLLQAFVKVLQGIAVFQRLVPDRGLLASQQLYVQRGDDFPDDLVLNLETIVKSAIIGFRPDCISLLGINQFRLVRNGSPYAALQDIANA